MKKMICFCLLMLVACLFLGGATGCKTFGGMGDEGKKKDSGLSENMGDLLQQGRPG
jgi:hypothetical protein